VRQALNTLREQSQWLGSPTCWAKPCAPRWRACRNASPQQLDTEMAQLRVQRLRFEDLLNKQQLRQIRQADGEPLTSEQNRFWKPSCARSVSCCSCCRAAIR
jgi:potassium efflux system protein